MTTGFVGFYVAPTRLMLYSDLPAFLVEEVLRCPSVIISGTNGYLSRTTDVPAHEYRF